MSAARRNLEVKARLADLPRVRPIVRDLCGQAPIVEKQTDTYFHAPLGRLKLREIVGAAGNAALLIAYDRPDRAETRTCQYHLVPVADADLMKTALSATLGVRGVVHKRREITLYHNVRIHLDEVADLGGFLELEAVLSAAANELVSQQRLDGLLARLGVAPGDFLAVSYAELLAARD